MMLKIKHRLVALEVLLAAVLAACGGGSGSDTSTNATSESESHDAMSEAIARGDGSGTGTHTVVTITPTAGGTVVSSPAGINCSVDNMGGCTGTFDRHAHVVLNATADDGYTFSGYGGGCSGMTCEGALHGAYVNISAAFTGGGGGGGGAPIISYVDTPSAPTQGGENGLGGYLSIFGRNFGTAGGLGTTTKVYIGGVEVANYRYLGASKVAPKLGMQQIAVQVGHLNGEAAGTPQPIKVVVSGTASNTDQTFTPTNGHVLFVSLSGNDGTAARDDIKHPWRYLQNQSDLNHRTGAYYTMGAGDQVVIRGGTYSDTYGVDHTWMRFDMGGNARNGTAKAYIHITAYPGAVDGNGVEDVHYSTPPGVPGGIEGPWSAIAGTSGEYIAVSNLRFDVQGGASQDAGPINFQYSAGHWRVVNNEIGPWVAGNSKILNAAGISGNGDTMVVMGNLIHDIEGTADLQNHGIYADTGAQNWEVAYNWIHDISGGSLVQFNDCLGGAGSYPLPHGGIWQGFVGINVHHNWLENAAKYGVHFNDQGSTKIGKYSGTIWNNVIIGTALPPLRINSTQPTQQLWFAFNTMYDDMTTYSYTGNGYVRAEGWSSMAGVHNVFYNNIFMFGPDTTSGTQWFSDAGAEKAKPANYDFKRNVYFAGTQNPNSPGSIGDNIAIVGDPQFVNAPQGDFETKASSPARKATTQGLPNGMKVPDDITTMMSRPLGEATDVGAYVGH
jgi:hypothetical protein